MGRALSSLLHGRGDLIERGSRFLKRGGLLLGAAGQVGRRRRNLDRAGLDGAGAIKNVPQRLLQLIGRGVEILAELPEAWIAQDAKTMREIVVGEFSQSFADR